MYGDRQRQLWESFRHLQTGCLIGLSEWYYYRAGTTDHNCPAFRGRPGISVCHITYITNPAAVNQPLALEYSICTGGHILDETPVQVSHVNQEFIRVQETSISILPPV